MALVLSLCMFVSCIRFLVLNVAATLSFAIGTLPIILIKFFDVVFVLLFLLLCLEKCLHNSLSLFTHPIKLSYADADWVARVFCSKTIWLKKMVILCVQPMV
jgi:hypothetical protein